MRYINLVSALFDITPHRRTVMVLQGHKHDASKSIYDLSSVISVNGASG